MTAEKVKELQISRTPNIVLVSHSPMTKEILIQVLVWAQRRRIIYQCQLNHCSWP